MKIKMSQLKAFIKESVEQLKDSYIPDEDGEVELDKSPIRHDNEYDYDDHDTYTKMKNAEVTMDVDEPYVSVEKLSVLKLFKNEANIQEKAPKGWENSVKRMKKHKDIDNPYALANYMKKKGDKPHPKRKKKKK